MLNIIQLLTLCSAAIAGTQSAHSKSHYLLQMHLKIYCVVLPTAGRRQSSVDVNPSDNIAFQRHEHG